MNYIARTVEGVMLVNKNHVKTVNMSLNKCVDTLCIHHGSTKDGRLKAARILLEKTANIPIYVSKNIILFPTQSIRQLDSLYINYCAVDGLHKTEDGCSITFKDCQILRIGISYEKMKKRLALTERFSLIMKSEKKVFTL